VITHTSCGCDVLRGQRDGLEGHTLTVRKATYAAGVEGWMFFSPLRFFFLSRLGHTCIGHVTIRFTKGAVQHKGRQRSPTVGQTRVKTLQHTRCSWRAGLSEVGQAHSARSRNGGGHQRRNAISFSSQQRTHERNLCMQLTMSSSMEKSSPGRIIVRHFSSADIPTAPLFSLAEATFRAAIATNQQSTATSERDTGSFCLLVRNHRTHTVRCKLVTKLVVTKPTQPTQTSRACRHVCVPGNQSTTLAVVLPEE
jgi:hypothetical protein